VQFRANDTGILGALAVAIALGGCGNVDYENKEAWFSKPFQFVSKKGGFTIRTLTNPSSGPGRLPPMVLSKRMVHVRRPRPSKHLQARRLTHLAA
jgi:hypothetical protein